MISNFQTRLRAALEHRQRACLPPTSPLIAAGMLCTLLYIGIALVARPAGKAVEYHFVSEEGAITALSAVFLAMSGAFSGASLIVHIRAAVRPLWPWALMAAGFGLLSLDELLQFHERLGNVLDRHGPETSFRNWNDIVVILYGVVALPIAAAFLPSLLRYKRMFELLAIGFGFYALHTVIDTVSEPPTTATYVVEESCKLYCGLFLLLGSLTGFLGALWNAEASSTIGSS